MTLPQHIVCLSTELTEVLYLLGEQHRIVGISGYTTRPAIARKEKPRISAFSSAKIDKIIALAPDLVLGFSDIQSEIAVELVRAGLEVHIFNQRSIDQMLNMVMTVGRIVDASDSAYALVKKLNRHIDQARSTSNNFGSRPLVYFEEWGDPLITGVTWVSELIEIAGGQDCFNDLARFGKASERIISDPTEVVRRDPDIIIGSWCGKRFQPEQLIQRDGWLSIKAVSTGHIYEIKSADILQPGPSLITEGLPQLLSIIRRWDAAQSFKKYWD